jgi:hemoglobin
MRDIENRNELMLIMKKFYDLLLSDHQINFFFTETTNVNLHLHDHFETLTTFWEKALFYKGGYKKNMFKIHQDIHQKRTFTPEHFNIWFSYLN